MIRVAKPGLLTTVQDLGRPGLAHLGVPTAGAADRRAFGLANRLVGNPPEAAALEITLAGPELELEAGGWVALTGGRVAADLDGRPAPMDVAVRAEPGQVLRIGSVTSGLRAYLAVRGGIDVAPVLGSRSTDTLAPVGPPRLEEGMCLPVGERVGGDPFRQVAPTPPVDPEPVLRAVRGPRDDLFTHDALRALIGAAWTVTSDSDRTGVRLDGPVLERRRKAELASEGMVEGALQVPPDGHPILFLANHPTTGGYPVIAVVVGRDLPLAAQARPGTRLRFRLVTLAAARGQLGTGPGPNGRM
jgi:biotin-dependent carboxylase-like uncharacterized protein